MADRPWRPQTRQNTMQYPINEVFQSLQGEGFYTGVPAILFACRDARSAVAGAIVSTPGISVRSARPI